MTGKSGDQETPGYQRGLSCSCSSTKLFNGSLLTRCEGGTTSHSRRDNGNLDKNASHLARRYHGMLCCSPLPTRLPRLDTTWTFRGTHTTCRNVRQYRRRPRSISAKRNSIHCWRQALRSRRSVYESHCLRRMTFRQKKGSQTLVGKSPLL